MTMRRSRALYIGIVHWSRGGEELLQQLLSSCDDESYAHVDCHKDGNPNACLTYGQRTWTEPLVVSSGRPTAILGDEASLATIETVPRRAGIEFIDENGGAVSYFSFLSAQPATSMPSISNRSTSASGRV
jgi:hypothetical protein